jgi:hypothetical protein
MTEPRDLEALDRDVSRRPQAHLPDGDTGMDLPKCALLVGIDQYKHMSPLSGCVADAVAMRDVLQRHENGEPNYSCVLLNSAEQPVTRKSLRAQWKKLFDCDGHVLFHFSGHGTPTWTGGVLATQEGTSEEPGLPMDELLSFAKKSKAKSILLILDCCYAGHLGNPNLLQGDGNDQGQAYLRQGLTILAASRDTQRARETAGHGIFTKLVLGALRGGAADVRGRVSAAAIYAYAEQALGSWDQRPMYKSHAERLPPVRVCKPAVPDRILRQLPEIFEQEGGLLQLDPSFEFTEPSAKPKNVALFNKLKLLRNANLLTTRARKDLYFIALESGWVKLTALGQFYWNLAKQNAI